MVSRAQLRSLGLTPRGIQKRVELGRLVRLHRGVYAVGHTALTSHSRDMAAVLACGPAALLSHRAAAHSWLLLRSSSARIEVTADRGCKPKPGITVHRSRLIHPDNRGMVNGIPTTSVARTIVDLADVLGDHRFADSVNESEVLRLFDRNEVDKTLERLPGRRGRHRVKRILAAYSPDPSFTRSGAERRFLRLCADHGLPKPSTNIFIGGHELDAYWEDARLGIELDGEAFHHTTRAYPAQRMSAPRAA